MDAFFFVLLTGTLNSLNAKAIDPCLNSTFEVLLLGCLMIVYLRATLDVYLGLTAAVEHDDSRCYKTLLLGAFLMLNVGIETFNCSSIEHFGIEGLVFVLVLTFAAPASTSMKSSRFVALALLLLSKSVVELALAYLL
eukprot:TRINITY_DN10668_c0_g1_i1.p1 TRINITY_DN10668_c0_g1~~TRINITY_DN10668_c0_g1_i1.p1  ORF type:complete len:138 (-),score=20.56 TRINITY_DN10668_c0_g1_i1:62-475(-)